MKKLVLPLVAAAMITLVFGTIYVVSQGSLRQSANDPQIAMAEDVATKLDGGAAPSSLVTEKVELSGSLTPAFIIYDTSGKPVAGTARLNGEVPTIPIGVLKAAQERSYNAVTWRPTRDVRLASVSVAAKSYYVTAARSLLEVEKRETRLTLVILLGWGLGISGLGLILFVRR